jgi:hypothetical protein
MMRKFSRKFVVVAASATLLVVGGGVAFAFWTTGGTGAGTGDTGASDDITVNQVTEVMPMAPGTAAQALSGTFDNANPGPIYVTAVTASIASVFQDGEVAVGCDATDYTLSDPIMPVGNEVPAGDDQGAWTGASIEFANNPAVNQDACQGATVNLAYSVS